MTSARRDPGLALILLVAAALLAGTGGCVSEREIIPDEFVVDPVDVLPCGFTPLSGTRMSVYDCNPVFSATGEPWVENIRSVAFRTQAVLGHPLFQVWYTADMTGYDGWGLGHAVSPDGITWHAHESNPLYGPTLGWDAEQATAMTVAYDRSNDAYAILYQGSDVVNGSLGVGLLTSPNGGVWRAPEGGSQMVDLVADRTGLCWPLGLAWTNERGYFGYFASSAATGGSCEIFGFESPDLPDDAIAVDRVRSLRAGPSSYDGAGATSVAPVVVNGIEYLFYTGFRTWETIPDAPGFRRTSDTSLALATRVGSAGRWTKSDENPFPINLVEPGVVSLVGAQAIGDVWVRDDYPVEGTEAPTSTRRGIGYFLYEPALAEPHP